MTNHDGVSFHLSPHLCLNMEGTSSNIRHRFIINERFKCTKLAHANINTGTIKLAFPYHHLIMSSCWVVCSQPQVLWPNGGPQGNEYHYDTIWMTVDAVDAKLWDPDLDFFIPP